MVNTGKFWAVLVLSAGMAFASPNFSGKWKMNPSASKFGAMPPPTSMVRNITHADPKLEIRTVQAGEKGEVKTELKFTTDGKVCVNTLSGSDVVSKLSWEGSVLVIDSKRTVQGTEVSIVDRYSLSGDGRTLTIAESIKSPTGGTDITISFDKQ
jgi:hypothetical protein